MKVIISQPRYLPHISYMKRLYFADLFVFLDNVQRQARGVENRNKIMSADGKPILLTIPVKSSTREKISKSIIDGEDWVEKHIKTLEFNYKKHSFYSEAQVYAYYSSIYETLRSSGYSYSTTLIKFVLNACNIFGFIPRFCRATELEIPDAKGVENLYNIAKAVSAQVYISGSNGRAYGVKEYFERRGIKVLFHDPEPFVYSQKNAKCFVDWLAFFDPLFNVGLERVMEYIKAPPVLKES
ncbi:MAG: WbqC family protein [Hydrogenobacter thermophilus]|nr:WbqC family protein [Hydrogenobacter thermophilus]